MNALMICFLAAAVVSLGSRWWLLAHAAQQARGAPAVLPPILATAAFAAGLSAAFGASLAATLAGPGMLLLLAIALVMAAAGLAWPARALSVQIRESMRGSWSILVLLAAAMVSDSVPFIIFAAAAWTGEAVLAAVGGTAGLMGAALAGPLLLTRGARLPAWLNTGRRAVAFVLILTAAMAAVIALGVV